MPVAGTTTTRRDPAQRRRQRRITQRSAITTRPGFTGPDHIRGSGGPRIRNQVVAATMTTAIATEARVAIIRSGFIARTALIMASTPG